MKIVLASNNRGKLAELQAMLAPLDVELVRQADLGIPEEGQQQIRDINDRNITVGNEAGDISPTIFAETIGHHAVSDAVSPDAFTYSSSSQRKRPNPSNSTFGPSSFESDSSSPLPK